MITIYYDIRDFKWVEEEATFYGDGDDLFDAEGTYKEVFPSRRSQFVIKNYKTGNFRRFRFEQRIVDPFGVYYIFTSEEGYRCIISFDDDSLL